MGKSALGQVRFSPYPRPMKQAAKLVGGRGYGEPIRPRVTLSNRLQ
jgi:hypothetical protein